MAKKILIAVAAVIAIFLIYVAMQPSEYLIWREVSVNAAPSAIFPHINNSQKLNAWMPWAESDPQMKVSYSGPEEGVGASSSWDSPGQMGKGQAVITESIPVERVTQQITYFKPMEGVQQSDMTLTPGNGVTVVKWAVKGNNGFVGRLFCVFMNMDKMVGGEFEKGLSKLKATVEAK